MTFIYDLIRVAIVMTHMQEFEIDGWAGLTDGHDRLLYLALVNLARQTAVAKLVTADPSVYGKIPTK